MKITIFSGSPKGEDSVTLQYVRYLQNIHPEHDYRVFHVARQIGKLERDAAAFQETMDRVSCSDAVIWAFPLYFCLVCSQYKRFIELVCEGGRKGVFRDKYAMAISTSVHFFDHTAHNYIHGICDDLEMRYYGGYPAEMYDLVRSRERARFLSFAENFFRAAANGAPMNRRYPPLRWENFTYEPGYAEIKVDTGEKKILVLCDEERQDGNLGKMIRFFRGCFDEEVEMISLADVDIKGGCLGCCKCGLDNVCQYEGRDGFIDFYNEKVKKADIIVVAGEIRDRYLSYRWKRFFDRSFFNTHMPTLKGKQLAFIIAGPLGQLSNLTEILSAYAQFQQANISGIVTDEEGNGKRIDALLGELARRSVDLSLQGYIAPMDFLGVGGRKIFRDEVWGKLRFVFQADHRYYRDQGYYDFPQKNYRIRRMNLLMMAMTRIPSFKEKFLAVLEKEMVKPLKNIVEGK